MENLDPKNQPNKPITLGNLRKQRNLVKVTARPLGPLETVSKTAMMEARREWQQLSGRTQYLATASALLREISIHFKKIQSIIAQFILVVLSIQQGEMAWVIDPRTTKQRRWIGTGASSRTRCRRTTGQWRAWIHRSGALNSDCKRLRRNSSRNRRRLLPGAINSHLRLDQRRAISNLSDAWTAPGVWRKWWKWMVLIRLSSTRRIRGPHGTTRQLSTIISSRMQSKNWQRSAQSHK